MKILRAQYGTSPVGASWAIHHRAFVAQAFKAATSSSFKNVCFKFCHVDSRASEDANFGAFLQAAVYVF